LQKKKYVYPELTFVQFKLQDVLSGSPEYNSPYIGDDDDFGDDPIIELDGLNVDW